MNKRQAKKLMSHSSLQSVWLDDECTQLGRMWYTFSWRFVRKTRPTQGNTRRRTKAKWHIPTEMQKLIQSQRKQRRYFHGCI